MSADLIEFMRDDCSRIRHHLEDVIASFKDGSHMTAAEAAMELLLCVRELEGSLDEIEQQEAGTHPLQRDAKPAA